MTGILPALIKSGSMSSPYACGPCRACRSRCARSPRCRVEEVCDPGGLADAEVQVAARWDVRGDEASKIISTERTRWGRMTVAWSSGRPCLGQRADAGDLDDAVDEDSGSDHDLRDRSRPAATISPPARP